jgi:hypothetical protein
MSVRAKLLFRALVGGGQIESVCQLNQAILRQKQQVTCVTI